MRQDSKESYQRASWYLSTVPPKMPRAPSVGDKPSPSKEGYSLGDGPLRLVDAGQGAPRLIATGNQDTPDQIRALPNTADRSVSR